MERARRKIEPEEIRSIFGRMMGRSGAIDAEISSERSIRRAATLASEIPLATGDQDAIVDIGGTAFWIPIYTGLLGYRKITLICRPWGSFLEHFRPGESFPDAEIRIVECDAERSTYPLPEGFAACVACFDLLEHLAGDPMNILSEANRILRPDGALVLGTPNVLYYGNILAAIRGKHPYTWSPFTSSYADRHNREYTPGEIGGLFSCAGFDVRRLMTFNNHRERPASLLFKSAIAAILALLRCDPRIRLRNANILAVGTKTGAVAHRFPGFLYELNGRGGIDYGAASFHPHLGIDKEARTVLFVKSAPATLRPGAELKVTVCAISDAPIDILVDLFIAGDWRLGGRVRDACGLKESTVSLAFEGVLSASDLAYIGIKAVPAGKSWEERIIDIKLPYLEVSANGLETGPGPTPPTRSGPIPAVPGNRA